MSVLGNRAVTGATDEERKVTDAIAATARPMLESEPQMVHFPTIARAALAVIEHLPRIPRWRGRHQLNRLDDSPTAAIDIPPGDNGRLWLATITPDYGVTIEMDVDEARAFFLAGLAACAAIEDPTMIDDPDCATAPGAVKMTSDDPDTDPKDVP